VRVVKTPAPLAAYLGTLPIILGAVLAGARQWGPAIALLALGAAWYFVGMAWFARRVRRTRRDEHLTSRDTVEIEYPGWMQALAKGYIALLAGTIGLGFVALVVFVVVAVIRK
jgi:uncharacterized membrane protein HdeD (DUF308 family)